ncbi:curli polymerization inhibitor CsgI-related protein [Ursidibacter sp. B-7004-1]
MKLAKIAFTLSALFISATTLAGTVSSSSNINFLAFDGQKVKKSTKLEVNDSNQHQVVVEVSSIYHSGSDSSFFESQPIVITFAGSTEDIKITAPDLRTDSNVAEFKKMPKFSVKTASGKELEYKHDYLKGEGFMPNANIVENLSNYNSSDNVASLKSLAVTPMAAMMPTSNGKAAKGKVMVQGENIAEQQLQYWFQQADKETQKRFLDWAKKQ